jgi:hypothetical protein
MPLFETTVFALEKLILPGAGHSVPQSPPSDNFADDVPTAQYPTHHKNGQTLAG